MPESRVRPDFCGRPLAVAELPEDISLVTFRFAVASAGEVVEDANNGSPSPFHFTDRAPYFEIYRAEEVRRTTMLFSGGDWRWRFRSATGELLAAGVGYRSEAGCRAAVMALRDGASTARIVAAS